jgi:hypothetical protein
MEVTQPWDRGNSWWEVHNTGLICMFLVWNALYIQQIYYQPSFYVCVDLNDIAMVLWNSWKWIMRQHRNVAQTKYVALQYQRCTRQNSLCHFLVAKILIVCLLSVYMTKQASRESLHLIIASKPLWNTFSITKNIVFSAIWSWCTKLKIKDAKT